MTVLFVDTRRTLRTLYLMLNNMKNVVKGFNNYFVIVRPLAAEMKEAEVAHCGVEKMGTEIRKLVFLGAVHENMTKPLQPERGMPQGSVLEPALFILHVTGHIESRVNIYTKLAYVVFWDTFWMTNHSTPHIIHCFYHISDTVWRSGETAIKALYSQYAPYREEQ